MNPTTSILALRSMIPPFGWWRFAQAGVARDKFGVYPKKEQHGAASLSATHAEPAMRRAPTPSFSQGMMRP